MRDRGTVLVSRLDSDGDVLLAGPAIRAVASCARRVVLLVGPRGRQAAALLPGVDEIIEWRAPWIDPTPPPVTRADVAWLVRQVAARAVDEALVLGSYHQSPLPTALLLRLAGARRVSAICEDYPGSLLDVRHHVDGDPPESERNLSLAAAAGFSLPPGDDGRLRIVDRLPPVTELVGPGPYVVLHPGTAAPARAWPPHHWAETARLLSRAGLRPVVTGSADEADLAAFVSGRYGRDLSGRTSLVELAAVLAGSSAVVVANTGPAHLAAAVGAPVVSLFAPTVPAARWAPYGVRRVLLGDQSAPCRNTRAITCPVPGHPCLSRVTAQDVLAAVNELVGRRASAATARQAVTRPDATEVTR